jgi:hypothetical protein
MEEAGESRGGRLGEGVILTRRGTDKRLCPHPLLHYFQYVPPDCALGSVSGAKLCVTFQLREKEKGQGYDVGPTCQRQQLCKLRRLFNFHFLFYYDMAEAPSSTFNPLRLLQLQSSSPLHPS